MTKPPTTTSTSSHRRKWRWGMLAGVLLLSGLVYWVTRETDSEKARRWLKEARIFQAAGNAAKAEELAIKAWELDGNLSEAALIAAQAKFARQRFQEANELARQVKAKPATQRLEAVLLSAELGHHHLYDLSAAEAAYREALSLDPENLTANAGLADLLGLCGRSSEAAPFVLRTVQLGQPSEQLMLIARPNGAVKNLKALQIAHRNHPDDVNALLGLAWHADSVEKNAEASELLQQAVDLKPDLPAAWIALGRQWMKLGRFGDLSKWAADVPASTDVFGETWYLRGRLAEQQGDTRGAIRCYWESIKLAPEPKEASFHLAKVLSAAQEPNLAELFVEHVHRLDRLRAAQDQAFSQNFTDAARLQLITAFEQTGRLWEAFGWGLLLVQSEPENKILMQKLQALQTRLNTMPLKMTADAANPAMAVDLSAYPVPTFRTLASTRPQEAAIGSKAISFWNDADSTGLVFRFFNGHPEKSTHHMYQLTGGGIGVLDFDRDGYEDICFTQGCPWPSSGLQHEYTDQLFRNRQGKRFENATQSAGLTDTGFGQGVTVGDFNSDGFPDLYVAQIGQNVLWLNSGDGTFANVTEEAGLSASAWTTSCLMADLDGDGHPDLYDVNYLDGPGIFERICQGPDGQPSLCMPFDFEGQPDRLWLNSGQGEFTDATASRLSMIPNGKGLGIAAWDAQGQGLLSVFIANDTTPNFFFTPAISPDGEVLLEDRAILSGLAFNGAGKAEGCMGIALADIDNNSRLDVHVTNFLAESNTLWLENSPGVYDDQTQQRGLREPTLNRLGFGTQFLDANLDGRWELFVANGHIEDFRALGKPYAMPPQLFRWDGSRFLELDGQQVGPYFQTEWLGRAAARLDWNADGLPDLVVGHLYQDSALLTNTTANAGAFLSLKLIGTQSCRDAIGTQVQVNLGEQVFTQQLIAGDGYQASNSRELIFGTGTNSNVDELSVRWPSGLEQRFSKVACGTRWLLVEGERLFPLGKAATSP